MRKQLFSLAIVCMTAACGAVEDDAAPALGSVTQPLTTNVNTRLDALPSPVAMHAVVVGVDGTTYANEWSRLTALNYKPVSLTGAVLPDGSTRFSSVFHKEAAENDFVSNRGLTEADYSAKNLDLKNQGFRPVDVVGRSTSSGMRYDAVWVRSSATAVSSINLSLTQLTQQNQILQVYGITPVRLHGYRNASGTTVYSGVWVQNSADFRLILDQNGTNYGTQFDQVTGAGYRCIDIAVYPVGNEVRYTGIFVKDATITSAFAVRGMTQAAFETRRQQHANENYVLVDAEYYSTSTTSLVPRYAGVWIRRSNTSVLSNRNLDDASAPAAARTAIASLRTQSAGFPGSLGYVIEDLSNGNWLGFRINEPFYMASVSKVMIAAAVLNQVESGALTYTQTVNYTNQDILDTGDLPNAAGNSTLATSLNLMLDQSSTNATDRLVNLVTPQVVNRYLEDSGIVDVGEVTSICELDRRIMAAQNACVWTVPCWEFERWLRNRTVPTTTASANCLTPLTRNNATDYAAYYSTLANSATPLQFARLWRRLLHANIVTSVSSGRILGALAISNSGTESAGLVGPTYFTGLADKSGGKFGVEAYVGVGFNGGLPTGTAQYAISVFTEGWAPGSTEAVVEGQINQVLVAALNYLRAVR